MLNRIDQIEVSNRSLIPAEAEVWITVSPEHASPTTEVRGRLMGPRCTYASTIEVAYPLRQLPPGRGPAESPGLVRRVAIPEASLWDPSSPFLYEGPVELWQDGCRCDQVTVRHGLRSFQLTPGGLRVNGRPLPLAGRTVTTLRDEDAQTFRAAGCNLLLTPLETALQSLWDQADRLGFLVLGEITDPDQDTRRKMEVLSRHACCLGWVMNAREGTVPTPANRGLLGYRCHEPPAAVPPGIDFLVGPSKIAPSLAKPGLPLLVTGTAPAPQPAGVGGPLVLGTIA
jgi:hypothetical protein